MELEADSEAIKKSLIKWNKKVIMIQKLLNELNEDFQEIYQDVKTI